MVLIHWEIEYMIVHSEVIMKYSTRETRLLIELSRLDDREISPQRISSLMEVDWDKFLALAIRHKVLPVVERNIHMVMVKYPLMKIPYNYRIKMKMMVKLTQERVKVINQELINLSNIFTRNQIKAVLLKGHSLNYIYPGENLRPYGDIDLLVRLEDVERLHYILLENHYVFDNGNVTARQLKDAAKQTLNCIGNYTRTEGRSAIHIDVQKADQYNAWNLQDFYRDSIKGAFGFYCLNLIDCFVFSCFHAWHHYPKVVSVRLNAVQTTLRDYMEIRELYLCIKKENRLDDLTYRVKELRCDAVINNMLYLAERLYNVFCERNGTINCLETVENDFEGIGLVSYFERRMFYPAIEKEFLAKYYEWNSAPHSLEDFLECCFFDESQYAGYEDALFWKNIPCYQSGDRIFYDEPYGTGKLKDRNCKFCFSTGWNDKNLILYIKIFGGKFFWGKEDFYNPMQDNIKFIFNDDWSKVFTLQIKANGKHKMFIERENIFQLEKIEDNTTYFAENDMCREIITSIPWHHTSVIPQKGKKVFFYFNIIRQNREMRDADTIVFHDPQNRLLELRG